MKKFISYGSILGCLAVIIGAFGAHALKKSLSPYELSVFQTGSDYHFYHSLALILFGISFKDKPTKSWPAYCFLLGILIFSGSLYLLAILHQPKLGAITPIGGALFIAGWIGFALESRK